LCNVLAAHAQDWSVCSYREPGQKDSQFLQWFLPIKIVGSVGHQVKLLVINWENLD